MRDFETISTAITAAETGHLVFGTLHTSSAPATIDRIIDVFPPLSAASNTDSTCFSLSGHYFPTITSNKDRKGRVAATEIMINNSAVANFIRNEKIHQIQSVMQTSKAAGMQTLEMSLRELIDLNKIDQYNSRAILAGDINVMAVFQYEGRDKKGRRKLEKLRRKIGKKRL